MVSVVYHKDGTPQCSQCNTGYEDAEEAEYCCTSCVDCGFRQHGMHEEAQECCPCSCSADECWCSEYGDCCLDYLETFSGEWHHSNIPCNECGSDDVDYTKVYYCSQCGEDDLIPGEQCSCDNIVSSKDYFEQMICGDCDNAWIEDDYSAETTGATSYYIEEMVSIDDEEDFQTLFNLYLDLSDEIKDMESQGMQKTMRYLTAKRQQSDLSNRLDELQTEIKIMPEFEFDSEYLSRLSFRQSYTKPIAILSALGLAYFLGKKL